MSEFNVQKLFDIVVEQGKPPQNARLYAYPEIPTELLSNAKDYYAPFQNDEKPLILVDTATRGVFGLFSKPGSQGMLITSKKIYDGPSERTFPLVKTIDLKLIFSIHIFEPLKDKEIGRRLAVNGILLMGEKYYPKELSNHNTITWLSGVLATIVSAVQGSQKITLNDVVRSYSGVLSNENLYFLDGIPKEMIDNAASTFYRFDNHGKNPLLFYNGGKKGKSGVLVTDSHIFSHASGHDFYMKWRLSEIHNVWVYMWQGRFYPAINAARLYGWPEFRLRDVLIFAAMIINMVNNIRPKSQELYPVPKLISNPEGVNFNLTEKYYKYSL